MNGDRSDWHAIETAEVTRRLAVDPEKGLEEPEAAARLETFGPNRPTARSARGVFARFFSQLIQPLVLVLIGAGILTALLREWVDAGVILGVVLVNALVGLIQEGKAETSLAALARSIASEATVLRGGVRHTLDAAGLVPGDVVVLAAGDKVPADLRMLDGRELRVDEAPLTGESVPVGKRYAPLPADTPLADRSNMAYGSTLVVAGHGTGVVVATGGGTEVGRISSLIAQAPDLTTPLTRKIDAFSHRLLWVILTLAAITFAVGIMRGESILDMFMAAVALAVGAIPEGLPAAIIITLAIGVARMAGRGAIIRRLPAVETLGSTTVICSDKTGTLTENAMTVREVWAGGETFSVSGRGYDPKGIIGRGDTSMTQASSLRETLLAGVLCNDARLVQEEGQWKIIGDPTEGALLVLAHKGGLDHKTLASVFPRLDELSFDSTRQYMATVHEIEGARIVYVKGAVEKLLPVCASLLDHQGRAAALDADANHAAAAHMAENGLRVLAMIRSTLTSGQRLERGGIGHNMVFLGLVGMLDPPRPRAVAAVSTCHAAGIRVKMITGDHPGTALAIARQLGILRSGAGALTGRDLAEIDDLALPRVAAQIDVFARVEPEQKLRLVKALQADGEVVAMTGDGVNDAPALKQADIGVAMGRTGTEVAKEAAAMVLTDDNFATIEVAIEVGRGIYDNLVKFIVWTLPTNAGEGLVILAAIFAGTILPIAPLQILWINMTTAVLLGLMLAFEPAERGIMQRPPRPPDAPILDRVLVGRTVLVILFLLGGSFGLFELALHRGRPLNEARTIAADLFVLVETFYLFNCRSLKRPFWFSGTNIWVWIGSATMLALQLAFTYVPVMNRTFQTAPISFGDWILIITIAAACAATVEIEKWLHSIWLLRKQENRAAG
ncbi:MAG: cation-translocating P-type ATPase [Acidiferrobacterales bacterium]